MRVIEADFKGCNPGHYCSAMASHGMLYISGILSIDPDTREVCRGGIREHTQLALANLDRVLAAAGIGRNDVVLCRIYTPSARYWHDINAVYAGFFGPHKPARSVAPTSGLHMDCLVEIEAVAELKD